LASAVTIGSGGSAGREGPTAAPSIAPFVIVGMAALFGGAAKAPLSMAVMVVEMMGSFQLLPAAVIAAAVSYIVTGNNSIYRSQVPTRRDSPAHAGG